MENILRKVMDLLPGYNCGACNYPKCDLFAEELLKKNAFLEDCPILLREDFNKNFKELKDLIIKLNESEKYNKDNDDNSYKKYNKNTINYDNDNKDKNKEVIGIIDGYRGDFILDPLPGESSCRETLMIPKKITLNVGDYIQYRPLGCPIPHFAKIIQEKDGLYVVHIQGPCHRIRYDEDLLKKYKNVGIAIVLAFEGIVVGRVPEVGHTVKFIPNHCMMQKVHSGVVVEVEGKRIYIEGIDLKVF